jgi:hypothetical protein
MYFSLSRKVLSIVLLLIVWITLRLLYFKDLRKGFDGQRRMASKIEDVLGLFDKSIYTDSDDSIYPKEWKRMGKKGAEGKFFDNTYNLIAVGFGILFLVIVLIK